MANKPVVLPFSFEELTARVQGLLRRVHGWCTPLLVCGPYVLDTHVHSLTVNGAPVELTTYEYRVLEQLMLSPGRVISATELGEHLYNEELEHESNVIAQLICRLRRKLDPTGLLCPIQTVRGDGYRFVIPRTP